MKQKLKNILNIKAPVSILSVYKIIFLLLVFYTALRLVYLLFHFGVLPDSVTEVLHALVSGIRFDLVSVVLLNLPFLIFFALISARNFSNFFIKTIEFLFLLSNSIFIGINITDIELIHFIGRRMSWGFFKIQSDIVRELPSVISDYWYMIALQALFIALFIFCYLHFIVKDRRLKASKPVYKRSFIEYAVWFFVFLVSLVLMARGGLQLKPLKPQHAFIYQSSKLGHLALNSTFTILKSRKKNSLKKVNYYSAQQVYEYLDPGPIKASNDFKFKNVVLIILESFAKEYTGIGHTDSGYTPFLNSLSEQALSFEWGFSNGLRSIESMPSILCAIPTLLNESIVTSHYQANDIHCLPRILASQGFYTSFYHGAENGTMFFDSFTKRTGIENYFGLNEYNGPSSDFDGVWGIFDRPYLQYVAKQFNRQPQPFFSTVFTLSSHHPYNIPDSEKDKFKEGEIKIHKSISYADDSLKDFFLTASKMDWFKETLFIITADHTQKRSRPEYESFFGAYRVPFIFYSPKYDLKKLKTTKLAQHVDILASTIDLLNINNKHQALFGRSVFSNTDSHFVINKDGENFWFYDGDNVLKFNPSLDSFSYFNYSKGLVEVAKPNESEYRQNLLKSYIQYHHNSMVDNRIYNYVEDMTIESSTTKN